MYMYMYTIKMIASLNRTTDIFQSNDISIILTLYNTHCRYIPKSSFYS